MSVYAFAFLTIEDSDAFAAYREVAGEALAKHGGQVVKAGPAKAKLDGDVPLPNVMALLEFPSEEQAHAWRDDPELKDVHSLRNKGGVSDIFLLA